ncbi:hypothetical protein LGH70_15945 [Hymenobacter sp. BT635]|uniref:DUF3823 domain-containing protein n=1 Tax=Hymenobacter nitidus TaxID=2880929 RepID=A0ABS8AG71_9BACT|nr:hypothetical protein [Hymenobacter nitidus]MCB2379094.1 hypothetical protein [Hymenobacter nitidus]
MFRTLKIGTAAALAATAGLLPSCIEAPDYPDAPRIEFKELRVERNAPGGVFVPIDSVKITVDFTDGNGDLGLEPDELSAPYNPRDANGNYNRTTDNYFIKAFRRSSPTAEFVPYESGSTQGYSSRYPRLFSPDGKTGPLKGSITFTLPLTLGSPFFPGEELRFEVSIMDRALNESNKITTSSYIVQPR